MTTPVNYSVPDHSEKALRQSLDYVIALSNSYAAPLEQGLEGLRGKQILEIGPGINLGAPLIFACYGARVTVVDRFLTPWFSEYHYPFYQMLLEWLKQNRPHLDFSPIEECMTLQKHSSQALRCFACPAETLQAIPDASIDVSFSNAVFEHFYDVLSACESLSRVTRPGGLGFHQVDFRDHRDFSKPLEYLLLDDVTFQMMFDEGFGECGNRVRPQEMQAILEGVGFEIVKFEPNQFSQETYLQEFIPRLHEQRRSRYSKMNSSDLRVISGRFSLRRTERRSPSPVQRTVTLESAQNFWSDLSGTRYLRSKGLSLQNVDFLLELVGDYLKEGTRCLVMSRKSQESLIEVLLSRGFETATSPSPHSSKPTWEPWTQHPLFFELNRGDKPIGCMIWCDFLECLFENELPSLVEHSISLLPLEALLLVITPNNEDLYLNSVYCPQTHQLFHPWQHLRTFTPESLKNFLALYGIHCETSHQVDLSPYAKLVEKCKRFEEERHRLIQQLDRLGNASFVMGPDKINRTLKSLSSQLGTPKATEYRGARNLRLGDGSTIVFVGRKSKSPSLFPK